jgi:hypothetical protein
VLDKIIGWVTTDIPKAAKITDCYGIETKPPTVKTEDDMVWLGL